MYANNMKSYNLEVEYISNRAKQLKKSGTVYMFERDAKNKE